MNKGKLFVISGPSGVGKGTICRELVKKDPSLSLSVSATTRAKREEDKDGVTYYFISKDEFESLIESGGFLEWNIYNGNYYGTPVAPVNKALDCGKNFVLEIDVNGGKNVRKVFPEAVLIFITPPDKDELFKRLSGRGSETPDSIKNRLDAAKREIEIGESYDYVIVNNVLDDAVTDVLNIIAKEND